MTIYELLKYDHEVIKDLLVQIEKLGPENLHGKQQFFFECKKEIIVHSKAEEKTFYATLNKFKEINADISVAKQEHEEVALMLERLSKNSLSGTAWHQLFKHMTTSLYQHIEEEENRVFALASKVLTDEDAVTLGEMMALQKKEERIVFLENHCSV